jgi:hypothetical protein
MIFPDHAPVDDQGRCRLSLGTSAKLLPQMTWSQKPAEDLIEQEKNPAAKAAGSFVSGRFSCCYQK